MGWGLWGGWGWGGGGGEWVGWSREVVFCSGVGVERAMASKGTIPGELAATSKERLLLWEQDDSNVVCRAWICMSCAFESQALRKARHETVGANILGRYPWI